MRTSIAVLGARRRRRGNSGGSLDTRAVNIVVDGNSRTDPTLGPAFTGAFPVTRNWVQVLKLWYEDVTFTNVAQSGFTTRELLAGTGNPPASRARFDSTVHGNYNALAKRNILIIDEIRNDLDPATNYNVANSATKPANATDAYNNFVTYIQYAQSKGWEVIACCCASSGGASVAGTIEADRITVNASLVTNKVALGIQLVRTDQDTEIGALNAYTKTSTTYQTDQTHFRALGQARFARNVRTTLTAMLNSGAGAAARITFDTASVSVAMGAAATRVKAYIADASNKRLYDQFSTAVWASTDETKAVTSQRGLVTGIGIGSPSVTVTVGSAVGTLPVTVTSAAYTPTHVKTFIAKMDGDASVPGIYCYDIGVTNVGGFASQATDARGAGLGSVGTQVQATAAKRPTISGNTLVGDRATGKELNSPEVAALDSYLYPIALGIVTSGDLSNGGRFEGSIANAGSSYGTAAVSAATHQASVGTAAALDTGVTANATIRASIMGQTFDLVGYMYTHATTVVTGDVNTFPSSTSSTPRGINSFSLGNNLAGFFCGNTMTAIMALRPGASYGPGEHTPQELAIFGAWAVANEQAVAA